VARARLLSPPRLSARSRRPPRAGRPLSTDASAGASALVPASAAGASALVPASAAGATASALWPLCSARRRWRCRRPPPSPSVLGASVLGAVLGSAAGAAAEASGGADPKAVRSVPGASAGAAAPSAAGFGSGAPAGRDAARRRRGAGAAAPFSLPAAGAVGAEVVSGNESCGAELPPDWRSLIAAMRSPLRMPVMSVMFSSPASWRSSASTMPESPRLRGAAVLTSSVSLKVVLPDLPGVVPGSANFTRDVGGRIAGRAVVPTGGTVIFATSHGKEAARPKPDPKPQGDANSGASGHAEDAWIAVAPSSVDVTTGCGNNPPPDTPYATSTTTPAVSIERGSGVNPWRSTAGTRPSVVKASTVGPAPEMAAATPCARSASTRSADSG